MKPVALHFFSRSDNSPAKPQTGPSAKPTKLVLTGYVSSAGKLVLPAKTVTNLGIDFANTFFKVGMEEGKRKAKSIYLVPASREEQTFSFEKAAKSYSLALPYILTKSGVDFSTTKYEFTIHLFDYEGRTAFDLRLAAQPVAVKAPYVGKSRGRKPKQTTVTE